LTYSVIGLDREYQMIGVAVASGSVAVGSRVPWARLGVGGVATQAYTNPALGPMILGFLEEGLDARASLEAALRRDPSPDRRQVGVLAWSGDSAVFEGRWIPPEHGYVVGDDYLCLGNLLRSQGIVEEMCRVFRQTRSTLPRRLLEALKAGHRAGGDARGDRSAAILVAGPTEHGPLYDKVLDLRVDLGRTNPVEELELLAKLMGF
jgi:uncharacterized Ntn-hydrolase superfamily protein